MRKIYNVNTLLLIIIVLLFMILVFKDTTNHVVAQGNGDARYIFGVVGEKQGNRQPFYLVDTEEQTIMIYEYFQGGGFGLVAARNYKYDRKLQEYGKTYGLCLADVKAELSKTQIK